MNGMMAMVGFAHVSVVEDLFYILHEEQVAVKSSNIHSHWVKVEVKLDDAEPGGMPSAVVFKEHKARVMDRIGPYLTPLERVGEGDDRWYKFGVKTDICDRCQRELHLAGIRIHKDGECTEEWLCADCERTLK